MKKTSRSPHSARATPAKPAALAGVTPRYGVAQRVATEPLNKGAGRVVSGHRSPVQPAPLQATNKPIGSTRQSAVRENREVATPSPGRTVAASAMLRVDVGIASERARQQMVQRLQQQGIRDPQVLQAMLQVPRHHFVEEGLASRAYEDTALPIGHAQTISQPYIVARMIEYLRAGQGIEKVLEIGTGCGYQAAVLGGVFTEVYSIERIRALHDLARQNLRPLRLPNVRLSFGDGMLGLPQAAPFDGLILAAAGMALPAPLLAQIRPGGRILAPVQHADGKQYLWLYEQPRPGEWVQQQLEAVRFVPLLHGVL
ncbi:protein-L-isoaspartate(D-aspartate) O-methyltransferase [Parvibium lacunae]|uniref:Protein-L-isoaspartate O-methyltransferase n=1 Tax=Parvibium lacunae TaxID=1888893 RepID=A0A368L7A0_9BURK|nr:protein-L-isoaspartate(D-aspartate) O-methyltransferase [Parvibium lacunae]RCS59540.1 protein-L-isoaspartate(D-aspartate) O-methyltransferase [Parvibium lacunae]